MTVETGLLITIVILGAGMVIGVVMLTRTIGLLRKEVNQLQNRIARQDADLTALQAQLTEFKQSRQAVGAHDPIIAALEGLAEFQKRGPVGTAIHVGMGLIRAYWKPKRRALPAKSGAKALGEKDESSRR
ncbi:hypothetical protein CCB81_09530 [Armatimonadetes bacterium Uphvl-Ar2]|nr:hypothetical protein CCB81_09530 [Armatimonadetes bacterium Uphvl-Ar2]